MHHATSTTLFPYTTLFRSCPAGTGAAAPQTDSGPDYRTLRQPTGSGPCDANGTDGNAGSVRSEEHTSELQLRENLVCRLLLEKKKKGFNVHLDHVYMLFED